MLGLQTGAIFLPFLAKQAVKYHWVNYMCYYLSFSNIYIVVPWEKARELRYIQFLIFDKSTNNIFFCIDSVSILSLI